MATTARIGNRKTWTVNVGAYNGGTHDHSKLFNRDADNQHPMGAIKGLETFAKNTNAHMESKENPHGVTASQVGARPDTWMPTASQVGAAPAGYGLGTTATDISNQNLITATVGKSGFYRGLNVAHAPDSDWWRFIVNAGIANSIILALDNYGNVCYLAKVDNSATSVTWNKVYTANSKPTAAEVGAAPAGYGLGEDFPREATDIESVAKSGFVRWYNNTITAIPYGWYYGMYIDYGTDDGLLLLKQYNSANMVLRHRGNDGWNAWEWVNPSLSLGVI